MSKAFHKWLGRYFIASHGIDLDPETSFCYNKYTFDLESQIILGSKFLRHHFYLPNLTSLLSTPLSFWTCIITLGK